MKKHTILILFLITMLAGCAPPTKHYTPSGRPEVTIIGAAAKDVSGVLTNEMINRGYFTKTINEYMLVFEKPITDFMMMMLAGSRYDAIPYARITYNISTVNDKTRIVASFAIVTNPGSAFERITRVDNSKETVEYQRLLVNIKNRFSKQSPAIVTHSAPPQSKPEPKPEPIQNELTEQQNKEIEKIETLYSAGAISREEYVAMKEKILNPNKL